MNQIHCIPMEKSYHSKYTVLKNKREKKRKCIDIVKIISFSQGHETLHLILKSLITINLNHLHIRYIKINFSQLFIKPVHGLCLFPFPFLDPHLTLLSLFLLLLFFPF